MKETHQTPLAAPSWTRAKSLLSEQQSAVRLSISVRILIGKELEPIRERLFPHGAARKGSSRQFGDVKTWDQWCRAELQIPARTCDRYIECFKTLKAIDELQESPSQA